jgi:hypothetical protein
MPYPDYRVMSDEDLASVIVYLRSIPPMHKALPKTEIIFPVYTRPEYSTSGRHRSA